jgi:endonuclease/exonuclease/phosphatase family metal-dependent hydrolase
MGTSTEAGSSGPATPSGAEISRTAVIRRGHAKVVYTLGRPSEAPGAANIWKLSEMVRHIKWISGFIGLGALIATVFWPLREQTVKDGQINATSADRIHIVTYNTQLLPGIGTAFSKYPNADYRARAIAERLAPGDVVGLCEVFDKSQRLILLNQFRERLGDQFFRVVPGAREQSVFGIDSGLVLVSRFPILESHLTRFGNDSPITGEHGIFADGFAAKGIIHVRIGRHPAPDAASWDCFLTHLESADSKRRDTQYSMLAEFVSKHSHLDRPVVIMGDLNTRGDAIDMEDPLSKYHRMLSKLRTARPGLVDLGALGIGRPIGTSDPASPSGGERIDYVLVSNPTGHQTLRPTAYHVRRLKDATTPFLSDHCAVEVEFSWNTR